MSSVKLCVYTKPADKQTSLPCKQHALICVASYTPWTLTVAVSDEGSESPTAALQLYTYPPDWVSEVVKVLVAPDVVMMMDAPLCVSVVKEELPRVRLDHVNAIIAEVVEDVVAEHVRLKPLWGGTSITDVRLGVIATDNATARREKHHNISSVYIVFNKVSFTYDQLAGYT